MLILISCIIWMLFCTALPGYMVIKSRRKPVHIGHKPDYPKIQRLLRENGYDLLTETWDGKPLTDLGNVVEDAPKAHAIEQEWSLINGYTTTVRTATVYVPNAHTFLKTLCYSLGIIAATLIIPRQRNTGQ